jgi:hypothetical protein
VVVCPDLFAFTAGTHTWEVPYCHNFDLAVPNPAVTRVVVAIHGIDRNAVTYYDDALAAAEGDGVAGNTLIVAPQFLNETDVTEHPSLPDDVLYWNSPWRDGARSSSTGAHPRADRVSSYAVLDALLSGIADSGNFPNLDTVVVSGHSAGGQFTQRYAASNTEEAHLTGDLGLAVRYVPMNPSSYLYLDGTRWDADAGAFDVPTGVPGYNDYPYGLDNITTPEYAYVANVGPDTIRAQYAQRQVVYLLGEQDVDRNDPNLDRSPAADLEGYVRFERGNLYFAYVQDYYGPDILNYHGLATVPGLAHMADRMYASTAAATWVFGVSPPPRRAGDPAPGRAPAPADDPAVAVSLGRPVGFGAGAAALAGQPGNAPTSAAPAAGARSSLAPTGAEAAALPAREVPVPAAGPLVRAKGARAGGASDLGLLGQTAAEPAL